MFFCNIIRETVTKSNINIWERKIKLLTINNLYKKILKRYQVSDINEYINLIKDNIDNSEKLKQITYVYEKNKENDIKEEKRKENERLKRLLLESTKYKDSNIKIRMLLKKDRKKAIELYIKFKILMEEDIEDSVDNVDDFILKNTIFGLFDNKELAGIIILDDSKYFKIDNSSSKIKTFYIQEMIVDDKYKGKGYGNLLINYAILKCPLDIEYISFMTMPSNNLMIKIAKRFNFILQELPSGDKKHSLLFIRNNDKLERELYTNLSYYKSKPSSLSIKTSS